MSKVLRSKPWHRDTTPRLATEGTCYQPKGGRALSEPRSRTSGISLERDVQIDLGRDVTTLMSLQQEGEELLWHPSSCPLTPPDWLFSAGLEFSYYQPFVVQSKAGNWSQITQKVIGTNNSNIVNNENLNLSPPTSVHFHGLQYKQSLPLVFSSFLLHM